MQKRDDGGNAGSERARSGSGAAPRLHARALAILRQRIASGVLRPGTRLHESHIAAEFGISRAPVRQALAALEETGALTRSGGQGYVVAETGQARAPRRAPPLLEPVPLLATASWEPIYAEVEAAIVARTSFASWRVVEAELARHYGVSRTVAREVVARLHQRGIVRKDDRSRWYAPALTPDYVAELYELRAVLEPVALKNSVPSIPADLLPRMRRNLDDAIAHAETLDGAALDRLEAEMHIELLSHCGNRTLMEALRLYQSLLVAHSFLYGAAPRLYRTEPFLPEHEAIIARLEAGRIDDAAAALEAHLRASLDRAIGRIDAVARDFHPEELPYLKALG
jgi:DNA-binding GntR family transcriptional regulator